MDRSPQPLRGFLRVLWIPLVVALPIAIVFGTLDWIGWLGYRIGYEIALCFAYPIALCVWLTNAFLVPRAASALTRRRRIWLREVMPTTLSALVGALVAVRVFEWLQPGSIGGALAVAQVLMFTVFFTALAITASYAVSFHRDSVEQARTEEELRHARNIQRTVLERVDAPGLPLDMHSVIVPSRHVSGDFLDVLPAHDGAYFIAIADVAGERMPAALLASTLQAALRMQTATSASVAEIVRSINRLACQGRITEEYLFATLFLARFEPRTMQLTYTNAGHRHPLVFRGSGEPLRLVQGGTVIGMLEGLPYEEGSMVLQSGDRVLLYTDGATEARSPRGEMFGEERLSASLRAAPASQAARQLVEGMLASLRAFQSGKPTDDDVAIMLLQVP